MKKWLMAAALLCAPVEGQGQVIIGTNPAATTFRTEIGDIGAGITQTFIARGSRLTRISFWFYGGEVLVGGEGFGTLFYVDKGDRFEGATIGGAGMDQALRGRVDIMFPEPLSVVAGDVYSFTVWTNNVGPAAECYLCTPEGDEYRLPALEMTTEDAFGDGEARDARWFSDPDREFTGDVRFEAEFTVPEPTSLSLVALGGFALLALHRCRRRAALPRS